MLEFVGARVVGNPSEWLRARAQSHAEALIEELLEAAVAGWQSEGFSSYSRRETALSIRVFNFCERQAADVHFSTRQIQVFYEAPQPTMDMLHGLANPDQSPRPDLTFRVGDTLIRVEAKRLADNNALPREYVLKGICRFTSGRYGVPGSGPGIMIGYVMSGDPTEIVARINKSMTKLLEATESEYLQFTRKLGMVMRRYDSQHADGVTLVHYHVDIPAR